MWRLYERSIACLSEARGCRVDHAWSNGEEDSVFDQMDSAWSNGTKSGNPDDIFSKSGTLQAPPWTKRTMAARLSNRLRTFANENYLFHGTDRDSAEAIIKEDFNIKKAGTAHAKI